jgi:hypothetical protein
MNSVRKIECKKSKHHGFYPETEECPWCDPPKPQEPGWLWWDWALS